MTNNVSKAVLSQLHKTIETKYWSNAPVKELLCEYSLGIDKILTEIWLKHFPRDKSSALFAVGGYGRRELHPCSDIDLLLVSEDLDYQRFQIEKFFRNRRRKPLP